MHVLLKRGLKLVCECGWQALDPITGQPVSVDGLICSKEMAREALIQAHRDHVGRELGHITEKLSPFERLVESVLETDWRLGL